MPVSVNIEVNTQKVVFRQSNKSREFAQREDEDEEQVRQREYIQLGSVLHNVLSSIRTSDDIDAVLW